MAALWLTESIPIPVTALLPIFMFPILQVAEAKDISAAYVTVSLNIRKKMAYNAFRTTFSLHRQDVFIQANIHFKSHFPSTNNTCALCKVELFESYCRLLKINVLSSAARNL